MDRYSLALGKKPEESEKSDKAKQSESFNIQIYDPATKALLPVKQIYSSENSVQLQLVYSEETIKLLEQKQLILEIFYNRHKTYYRLFVKSYNCESGLEFILVEGLLTQRLSKGL